MNNSISLNIKLDQPVYINDNMIEIGWTINGLKQSKNLKACNEGQGWHLTI